MCLNMCGVCIWYECMWRRSCSPFIARRFFNQPTTSSLIPPPSSSSSSPITLALTLSLVYSSSTPPLLRPLVTMTSAASWASPTRSPSHCYCTPPPSSDWVSHARRWPCTSRWRCSLPVPASSRCCWATSQTRYGAVPLCRCVVMLFCRCVAVSLCHSVAVSLCRSVVLPLCCCVVRCRNYQPNYRNYQPNYRNE